MKKIVSLVMLCLFFAVSFAQGDLEIKGKVIDEQGNAVANAEVVVKNTSHSFKTDANGEYSVALPEGKYVVKVSKLAYGTKTVILELNTNTALEVSLEKIQNSKTSRR